MPDKPPRVVLATPQGRSAVATVLVLGSRALSIIDPLIRSRGGKSVSTHPIDRILLCQFTDGSGCEDVVFCRRHDAIEIHCHGGSAAARRMINAFCEAGCTRIEWQDYIRETETDPISVAARIDLAQATTHRAAAMLLDQYRGALRVAIEQVIEWLESDQVDPAREQLEQLQFRASFGLHAVDPWRVVLAGRPNAGKSSLVNAILGYQRAIVFDQPGTTRDVLSARTAIAGWPVLLADSPGIRDSHDPLERQGIEQARRQFNQADVIVLVSDMSQPWTSSDNALVKQLQPTVIVQNKCDLPAGAGDRPPGPQTSAVQGTGLEQLFDAIALEIVPQCLQSGMAVPFRPSHAKAIRLALQSIAAGQTTEALTPLRRLIQI